MYSWREKAWDWGSECSDSLRAAWRREEPKTKGLERGFKAWNGRPHRVVRIWSPCEVVLPDPCWLNGRRVLSSLFGDG